MKSKSLNVLPLVLMSGMLAACTGEESAKKDAQKEAVKTDLSKSTAIFDNNTTAGTASAAIDPKAVVAKVDGVTVTGAELEKELQGIQMQAMRRGAPPEQLQMMMPQLRDSAVQNLVSKHVLLSAVAKAGIKISADELKVAQDDLLKTMPPGETLDAALLKAGVSRETFEKEMTEGLSIQKLMKDKIEAAKASEADAKEFYDKNPEQFARPKSFSARHILVGFGGEVGAPADDAAKAAAKKKAEDVIARLGKGEDFAKVCAEVSADPGSKDNGGLYENFPSGQMVKPFEDACVNQKIGEVGPPVETQFGYHIIKVEKRTEAGTTPFDEVKARLTEFLGNRKKSEVAKAYVEELRKAAKIDISEEFAPRVTPMMKAPGAAPQAVPANAAGAGK